MNTLKIELFSCIKVYTMHKLYDNYDGELGFWTPVFPENLKGENQV